MSVKIHHGPPGSYKTSGAVADDFLPAVKQGRLVITNVRGLTLERVREAKYPLTWLEKRKGITEPYKPVFPDVPDSFDIIHIDTTTSENRDRLARFFHWAPVGSEEVPGPLFIIDEAQAIFPDRWLKNDLAQLDYPGGLDAAKAAGRPARWSEAWEMHRHFGWDFTLTTPNISLIRSDIRAVSEGAFKHRNLATVGVKGSYMEAFHMAQDSGQAASHFLSVKPKKIPKQIWRLYDSTTTGTFSDTLAGVNIFKDPKIFGLLVLAAGSLGLGWLGYVNSSLYKASNKPTVSPPTASIPPPVSPGQVVPATGRFPPAPNLSGRVDHRQDHPVDNLAAGESPWAAVGFYRVDGKNFIVLRRDGVTRIVVNPKGAKFDGGRVEFQLDGLLVAGYTGKSAGAGLSSGVARP